MRCPLKRNKYCKREPSWTHNPASQPSITAWRFLRTMPSAGPGKRKAACLTPEPGATSATNQATSKPPPPQDLRRWLGETRLGRRAIHLSTGQAKQTTMQSFFAPKPNVMASAASTAAPSTNDPSPPPKLRSLFRCLLCELAPPPVRGGLARPPQGVVRDGGDGIQTRDRCRRACERR